MSRAFKLRIVGLPDEPGPRDSSPAPWMMTIHKAGRHYLDIVTAEELAALAVGDGPHGYQEIRLGLFGRIRWAGEIPGAVTRPGWMD